jgi:hypothetical protein
MSLAPPLAPATQKAAKAAKATADAPTHALDASTPGVPRAFSKQAIVRDMLLRAGGGRHCEVLTPRLSPHMRPSMPRRRRRT